MMNDQDVQAADAAWFKNHPRARQYVRHAFDGECEHAITMDSGYGDGTIIVLVTQIKTGRRCRRLITVPDDYLADYAVRNGPDCIGIQNGQSYLLLPGSIVNGRVLR